MTSVPGSFDGATGDVLDDSGRAVARVALDDQRVQPLRPSGKPGRIEGEVLGCFEDADPEWAAQLPRSFGTTTRTRLSAVSILLDNGERFDGVQVSPPWEDGPLPIHALYFPLAHSEF
jgi:hypothetical protein